MTESWEQRMAARAAERRPQPPPRDVAGDAAYLADGVAFYTVAQGSAGTTIRYDDRKSGSGVAFNPRAAARFRVTVSPHDVWLRRALNVYDPDATIWLEPPNYQVNDGERIPIPDEAWAHMPRIYGPGWGEWSE